MSQHEVWLSRPDGTRLALLDNVAGFEYSIALHDVGACTVVLPGSFDFSLLAIDNRLEFWRSPVGGSLTLERVYLIRKRTRQTDANGVRSIEVVGLDGNHLAQRRIIAYYAGDEEGQMTARADDMCRDLVLANLGSEGTAARQINSAYLSVAPARSAGGTATHSFSWRNLLETMQDIAEAAEGAGTAVYWHFADATPSKWEFRTYTGQPGIDHTYPSGQNPVLLGLEYGNLAEPRVEEDYSDEVTYVYGGGEGEDDDRLIMTAEDTARSGRSPFGRMEAFEDARSEEEDEGVTAAAQRRLKEGQPKLRFTARVVDSPGCRYGLHWRWGDRLTALYEGATYAALVRAVRVAVDGQGKEQVEARLEVDE